MMRSLENELRRSGQPGDEQRADEIARMKRRRGRDINEPHYRVGFTEKVIYGIGAGGMLLFTVGMMDLIHNQMDILAYCGQRVGDARTFDRSKLSPEIDYLIHNTPINCRFLSNTEYPPKLPDNR
jgi:hypothetical protein